MTTEELSEICHAIYDGLPLSIQDKTDLNKETNYHLMSPEEFYSAQGDIEQADTHEKLMKEMVWGTEKSKWAKLSGDTRDHAKAEYFEEGAEGQMWVAFLQ